MTANRYMTTSQVMRRFGVCMRTIRRWCEEGYFPGSFQVNGRGRWYIASTGVEAFERKMKEASE